VAIIPPSLLAVIVGLIGLAGCAAKVVEASPMDLVTVDGGSFTMGSPTSEPERGSDETQHKVTVSSFLIGRTEVTQAQYLAVMGTNPSEFKYGKDAPQRPVENVSWFDAVAFCNKLSLLEGLTPAYDIKGDSVTLVPKATGYRLPTEAEWEYAARGGTKSRAFMYSGSDSSDRVAWDGSNSHHETHAVATSDSPNELGIYDMSGNVWEWCWDLYGSGTSGTQTNPTGPSSGPNRVTRGGSWSGFYYDCRVACRYHRCDPAGGNNDLGFRVLRHR
jgi:formylglycine-generating enzyme required for sulfatase activity